MAKRLGEGTMVIVREFFRNIASELDPYTTDKATLQGTNAYSVQMKFPEHIQFAKYGRGAGKRPPLDAILDWVSKKGIIFEGNDEVGTAFLIQNAIGARGTLNYVPNAPNAIEEAFEKYQDEFNRKMAKELSRELDVAISNSLKKSDFFNDGVKKIQFKI